MSDSHNAMNDMRKKRTIRNVHLDRQTPPRQTDVNRPQKRVPTPDEVLYGGDDEHEEYTHSDTPSPASALPPRRPLKRRPTARPRRSRHGWGVFVGIAVVAIILFVGIATLFANATLTVTPRQENVTLNGTFQASQDQDTEHIPFERLVFSETFEQSVSASGEEQVDTKASGQILIFNEFGEADQRLVKNTRFESPEGFIYRIAESVTVPGRSENAAGEIVAGRVEVTVFADTSGDAYNVGLTEFTIPGFEGLPQEDGFYARSVTPMTGGFSGIRSVASEADLDAARATIRAQLTELLNAQARQELSDDMILLRDASVITYNDVSPAVDGGDVVVREEGTLTAIVFPADIFAMMLAEATVATYDDAPVALADATSVTFAFDEAVTPADITTGKTLAFTLQGGADLVWTFDEERLRLDLAGKVLADAEMVLTGYPALQPDAKVTLFPFWKRRFPENIDKINIEISNTSSEENEE